MVKNTHLPWPGIIRSAALLACLTAPAGLRAAPAPTEPSAHARSARENFISAADEGSMEASEGGVTPVPSQQPSDFDNPPAPPPHPFDENIPAGDVTSGRSSYGGLRWGGKLRLTNGIASLDGASGGGLAGWAIIAGKETVEGIGASAHISYVELPDYNWQSHGAAIGLFDRFELSYARQNLDTIDVGAALGLGRSYVLNQDVFGAKLRLFGDAVYGPPLLPQIAVGVQYKNNLDDAVTQAIGAKSDDGTDFYIAATKIVLSQSLLLSGTLRYTKANQLGLLGFGGDKSDDRSLQFEGSLGYMLSRNLVVGAEYRTKPDNLGIAREDDWWDLFAAWSITDHFTLTAAYADLGTIAIAEKQRGGLISLQASF
ncbi:DUF3034 family protein [Novosphingopyxis sp.]|uniref:DUF3034 family protein n=1 Tax=Novosphingopyxis sp. TaxID=2709690 RepID=UPI003B5AE240